jgi:hypothetical protein
MVAVKGRWPMVVRVEFSDEKGASRYEADTVEEALQIGVKDFWQRHGGPGSLWLRIRVIEEEQER